MVWGLRLVLFISIFSGKRVFNSSFSECSPTELWIGPGQRPCDNFPDRRWDRHAIGIDGGSLYPSAIHTQLLFEASYLTVIRTAAGSAVATRHLARADASYLLVYGTHLSPKIINNLTLFLLKGAGEQAGAHIQAIQCVRKLTHVSIVNRTIVGTRRKWYAYPVFLPSCTGKRWKAQGEARTATHPTRFLIKTTLYTKTQQHITPLNNRHSMGSTHTRKHRWGWCSTQSGYHCDCYQFIHSCLWWQTSQTRRTH